MPKIPGNKSIKQPGGSKKSAGLVTDNALRLLAFENSLHPNFISTVSTGKIIVANKAACKLLVYSKKELLTKTRSDIFDIKESSFKKMLKQRTAEGHSTGTVTAITRSGKLFPCEITSAVFIDENGIEKAITTISDLSKSIRKQKDIDTQKEKVVAANITIAKSKQKSIDTKREKAVARNSQLAKVQSDARLAKNNEWIRYIAKASYDVMWDWDIASGKIYIGTSIEEVFGYKLSDDTANFADFLLCLLPAEKKTVDQKLAKTIHSHKKSWTDSFMIRRQDGSMATTTSRASIIRDDKGKAIRLIGAIQDITRLQELENKLETQITIQEELAEIFLVAAKLSFDGIWDWNLESNQFFLGEGFKELFGYSTKKYKGDITRDWADYIHPDDRVIVEKGLQEAIASSVSYWEYAYRFIKSDGSVAKVFNRASIIRHADGKAYRVIGAMQDISKQKVLEEKLEEEISLKEKQISDAIDEARETERSDIGKELHDNISQLLGASKMYLDMAKRGGNNSQMYLGRSSEYTLTAIEEIRKLTKGLTTDIIESLGLCEAINRIAKDTMEVNPIKISCSLESFTETSVNNKFKLNIFRIIQEQLNNILKHANAKMVNISLSQNEKTIALFIADDGIGFDTTKKYKGIGVANIKSRAAAYQGTADFISEPGLSCSLTVTFPFTIAMMNKI